MNCTVLLHIRKVFYAARKTKFCYADYMGSGRGQARRVATQTTVADPAKLIQKILDENGRVRADILSELGRAGVEGSLAWNEFVKERGGGLLPQKNFSVSNANFAKFDFRTLQLHTVKARFTGCDFEECFIKNADGTEFVEYNLRKLLLDRASFVNAKFDECLIEANSEFIACNFRKASFPGTHLREAHFRNCILNDSDFSFAGDWYGNCELTRVWFDHCQMRHADFKKAEMRDVEFENSELDQASFEAAQLVNTTFKSPLKENNFLFGILLDVDFDNKKIKDTIFTKAYLHHCDLSLVEDLDTTDFSYATLNQVKLPAIATEAIFSDEVLEKIRLGYVHLGKKQDSRFVIDDQDLIF